MASRTLPRASFIQPTCERLEARIALALFSVHAPFTFTGLNNNTAVATADLNRDGIGDAVLTNFGIDYAAGAGTTISVLYGTSAVGFNRINLSSGGQNPSFIAIADINGDGWLDVVATNANRQNAGSVSVFGNVSGNLTLVGTPFSTSSNNPAWVGLSDVTGDGVLDAIVASSGRDNGAGGIAGNNITIFQGNADAAGHGNFTFSGPIAVLAPAALFSPTSAAVADFDGDGVMDIAATSPSSPAIFGQPQAEGSVYVFRGTGGGAFAPAVQFGTGGALPLNLRAAQINNDGRADLVVANAGDFTATPEFAGNSIGVLLNNSAPGNASFATATTLITNIHGPFAVAVDDFNRDAHADIAAVNFGAVLVPPPNAFVSIWLGNGAGVFSPDSPATYDTQTGASGGQAIAVGDFDANGTPDLIVAHSSNKVGLLLNTTVVPNGIWTGGGDGANWSDPANWSNHAIPTMADDVIIAAPGAFTVNLAAATTRVHSITLGNGGTSSPTLSLTSAGDHVLITGALTINGASRLDLHDNDLIVDYTGVSPLAAIANLIRTARANGAWTGNGLTSSAARDNANHNTTLGILESTQYKSIFGSGALFDGQPIDTTAILVKYTYYGDTDFNGRVNFDDYVRTDNGFNNHLFGWLNGDVDGNNVVNFDDYVLIDLAFNTQGAVLGSSAPGAAMRGTPHTGRGGDAIRTLL